MGGGCDQSCGQALPLMSLNVCVLPVQMHVPHSARSAMITPCVPSTASAGSALCSSWLMNSHRQRHNHTTQLSSRAFLLIYQILLADLFCLTLYFYDENVLGWDGLPNNHSAPASIGSSVGISTDCPE